MPLPRHTTCATHLLGRALPAPHGQSGSWTGGGSCCQPGGGVQPAGRLPTRLWGLQNGCVGGLGGWGTAGTACSCSAPAPMTALQRRRGPRSHWGDIGMHALRDAAPRADIGMHPPLTPVPHFFGHRDSRNSLRWPGHCSAVLYRPTLQPRHNVEEALDARALCRSAPAAMHRGAFCSWLPCRPPTLGWAVLPGL